MKNVKLYICTTKQNALVNATPHIQGTVKGRIVNPHGIRQLSTDIKKNHYIYRFHQNW